MVEKSYKQLKQKFEELDNSPNEGNRAERISLLTKLIGIEIDKVDQNHLHEIYSNLSQIYNRMKTFHK